MGDNPFLRTIIDADPEVRDRSFASLYAGLSMPELCTYLEEMERFRQNSTNLYHRVRATLFLYFAYRFVLMESRTIPSSGIIPYEGYTALLERRFEEAIACFRAQMRFSGLHATGVSALAEGYHHLAFQTLTDQVRKSVRSSRGNQWMFRVGNAFDHPVRIRSELLQKKENDIFYPMLKEVTPVRLDLSHSGWSDIFFLGMDFPEGARVLNLSVDLGMYGRDKETKPPIEAFVRIIPEPVLRLTSVDLHCTKDISDLRDLFNFGNDYLGLLKAGVIASGVVPPSFEGSNQSLALVLSQIVSPGMGLELITRVHDIPKGSRLAVSTNLLACIISVLMRATGQTRSLEGIHREEERRLVASRAILGEWLGGSGGGWQDSGGVWPGFKVIHGVPAREGDAEFGISRGCLLPHHRLLGENDLHPEIHRYLADSLVVIHGGIAQNVGPILEMVTEKYLSRGAVEWNARLYMRGIFDRILQTLKSGDIRSLASAVTENFHGPLVQIIPWVTNRFTETIIERAKQRLGDDFWGFLMLGGMSGGGMAMFVDPRRSSAFRNEILEIMHRAKCELEDALPFAMEPVVYDFRVNEEGTIARLVKEDAAFLPASYYGLQIPQLMPSFTQEASTLRILEIEKFTRVSTQLQENQRLLQILVQSLVRGRERTEDALRQSWDEEAERMKRENGYDAAQQEQYRQDIRARKIGLAHNRLSVDTQITDVPDDKICHLQEDTGMIQRGEEALRQGRVAVMTLAGGIGTRWTSGAGVVKALNPFVKLQGRHRNFLEIHLRKSATTAERYEKKIPHIISTSFLTHQPIEKYLFQSGCYTYPGPLFLSSGKSIGQRMIPTVRDLAFLWEEMPQETLDEQKQKVREATHHALMDWARAKGEGSDYVDNIPLQRFNPPGHWYEVPNMFRNGILARLLQENPAVETLMLHNVDTLGANLDAEALGVHLSSGNVLTFEVTPRRIEDHGGGLAVVNGHVRLLEGLAQPREEDELHLRYYNTMTTWIQIDPLLAVFGLSRMDLNGPEEKIASAIRRLANRMPTYVTIKDVKRRWGHGQEDIFPVVQFEKLWSDMSALSDLRCGFLAVSRMRGRQLKEPDQLDPWANDGGKEYVMELAGLQDIPSGDIES